MKNLILSIAVIAINFIGFSQMEKGSITYAIEIESDDPQMEMMKPMLAGSTLEMTFAEGKSKSVMKLGSVMTMTTIAHTQDDKMTMLMSGMAGKKGASGKISDIPEPEASEEEPNVELIDETKEILGFACKKAIITDSEGTELTFWYTEDISIDRKGQNMLSDKIPGVALEFELNNGQFIMVMTATEVSKKLPAKEKVVFDLSIPEGYDEVTLDSLTDGPAQN